MALNKKLFGLGLQEEAMLTADIEDPDECDALNDETFGEEVIPIGLEQWEIEDLAEQTENLEQNIRSQDDSSCISNYENSTDTLEEMVERSIVDLMAEDDFPIIGRSIPKAVQNENDFKSIFGSNSPQNPFLQFNQQSQSNIWGGSYNFGGGTVGVAQQSSTALIEQQQRAVAAAALLMNSQQQNNSNNIQQQILFPSTSASASTASGSLVNNSSKQQDHTQQLLAKLYVSPAPVPREMPQMPAPPVGVLGGILPLSCTTTLPPTPLKNARTLEELEAELKAAAQRSTVATAATTVASSNNNATSQQQTGFEENLAAVATQQQQPTLADLGILFNQQHQHHHATGDNGVVSSLLAANLAPPSGGGVNVSAQNMPRMPPALAANMAAAAAPYWSHVMMNPQIRAVVLACVAAGKPIPPGILPPPPPFFRMPFMPPSRMSPIPNPNFSMDMKSNASRSPQQHHMHRQFLNRRQQHFDQRGGGGHHQQNLHMMNNRVGNMMLNRDPYAGLMSRRERDWLVKIQTLQVQCENPYTDDYYFTMYNQKKSTESKKGDKNQSVSSDTDSVSQKNEDGLEHRHYVPPTFEGSLGKVQVSSVNCPRQLIDLVAATSFPPPLPSSGNNLVQSPSSFSSSPLLNAKNLSRSKKLTTLLLEIENCYKLVLECEELYFMQIKPFLSNGQSRRSDKIREIIDRIAANCQKCYFMVCTNNEKLTTVLNSRKGRRLIGMLSQYIKTDDLIVLIQNVLLVLPTLQRKETVNEIYTALIAGLRQSFDIDLYAEVRDWAKLFSNFDLQQLSTLLSTNLGYALLLTLVYYCSKEKTILSDEDAKNLIHRYASLAANEKCPIAGDKEMSWFGRTELSFVISWLTDVVGIDQFVVNKCESQWRNLLQ